MAGRVLRLYQSVLLEQLQDHIEAGHAPVAVLPTGGGKTVVFSRLIRDFGRPAVAVAHRKELVAQISRSLAAEGVTHRLVAPRPTARMIMAANSAAFGQSFISPTAAAGVAGVDSLKNACPSWMRTVKLVVQDEAHHILKANKWGKGLAQFPNAQVAGLTATLERADGKGLGLASDGVFSHIVRGPSMRELIDDGHLSEYRLFAPESARLDLSSVPTSPVTGDYSAPKLRTTMKAAHITGDVVRHYLQHARGQLGLTFVTDVESAEEMAAEYRAAGVPAVSLSAKTPPAERCAAIKRFARRELQQLVNVDLFGEGFDLSSAAGLDVCVEVVSMVRPTKSYGVFAQQFGRALRLGPGKTHATVIDHVGNTMRHNGPPDFPRSITLDARAKRSSGDSDVPMMRVCRACTAPYARERDSCPYCGEAWMVAERGTIDAVDGNLLELDRGMLAQLRAAAELAMRDDDDTQAHYGHMHLPAIAVAANVKRQRETREAQDALRARITEWGCEVWRSCGASTSRVYRRFYLAYGIDVLSACALKAAPARELLEKIGVRT